MTERKTINRRRRQGTLNKSDIPEMKLEAITEIPEPKNNLNQGEAAYYYSICQILLNDSLLAHAFLGTIERYAVYTYRWWQLKEKTEKNLGVQVYESGANQKDGHQNVMNDYEKFFQWFEQKFGFNPTDQDKVPKVDNDDDDW